EEITSRLSEVRALRVVSRRSTGDLSGQDADFVLEGSVRWNAAEPEGARRVRVTPRLVRVADGTQLWSRGYDRVIHDLFSVQSEIAKEIIRQLDIVLVEGERQALDSRRTESVPAYRAYLQGMELAGRRNPTSSHWRQAVERFERAVELDPGFALAWAELSKVHSLVVQLEIQGSSRAEALRTVERALEIDPDLPQGHRALGYYHYWCHRDYDRALAAFRRAAEGLPNDSQVLGGMAFVWRRLGRFEQARTALRRALDYDPDSAWLASELGDTLRRMRRYSEADPHYARAMELEPGEPSAFQQRCLNALQWRGDIERCRELLQSMPQQNATSSRLAWYRIDMLTDQWQAGLSHLDGISANLLRTDDNRIPIEYLRARVYTSRGESSRAQPLFAAARRKLERRLEKEGEDPALLHGLSQVLVGLGEDEAALRAARRAVALMPVEQDALRGAALLVNLASVHAALDQAPEAVELLQRVLSLPGDLSPHSLAVEPRWRPIAEDPAFISLLPG
ncbi:MAG: tetratricopeptide repeat protein, partial [Acidobacteriota bacterium]